MSDPNEPPGPEGSDDQAPPPAAPPPPPPAPPPPVTGDPYGGGAGAVGGGVGGYGAPPTDPYGQPPAGGSSTPPYSPTEAIGYGWRRFSASPGTLLIPMIVAWLGIAITALVVELVIVRGLVTSSSTFVQLVGAALAAGLITVVSQILTAGIYKGALHVTDGKPFGVGQMFDGYDKTQVVIAAVLVAVGTAIGTILCYIPGLIFSFLASYTMLFVVDKHLDAVEAIKASVQLVTKNLGPTLVYWILAAIVLFIGALLCGIGLLIAAPVALIGLAYTYRRLQNEPVAP